MERQFDLVVVGTGVTSAVASRCREAGWSVAVVDSRPFGGTCALRGCIPKKTLVGAAEAVHAARDMADRGVPAGDLALDWPALMRFKRSLIGPTTERTEQAWAKMGSSNSTARPFRGPTTLSVATNGSPGGGSSSPRLLPLPLTSRAPTASRPRSVPRSRAPAAPIVFVAAAMCPSSSHIAARAGVR